jgi:hypothetical protein
VGIVVRIGLLNGNMLVFRRTVPSDGGEVAIALIDGVSLRGKGRVDVSI